MPIDDVKMKYGFDLDDSDELVRLVMFDMFFDGDYSALVPLGHLHVKRGELATAYAIWDLALIKGQMEAKSLLEGLSRCMTSAEVLRAEEDVRNALPKVNHHNCI